MIAATALDASGEEDAMTWFTPMLWDWNGFPYLEEYLTYGIHVLWILVPLILIYPTSLVVYFLSSIANLLLYIYKIKNNIQGDMSSKSWDKAKQAIAYCVSSFAKIWHGYEVIGMENLPEGPGVIVYYHGVLTIDYGCFVGVLYREKRRTCYSVSHPLMFLLPGVQLILKLVGCADRSKANCVELLKKGELLGIAPGGLREQNFSNNNYTLVWGYRTGFAQVALEAKVPIIPMFTQNIREGYYTFGNTWLTRWLYEYSRWLILPVYGGFPVKLRTYIGEPIPHDPNITAKELAEKTKTALENLINQHQQKPGNIMRALMERFDQYHKDD
ncbi:DGAT1/2-independent enzyme synthesizing storage lipids-like [Tiliqua scincoides]|uniref:DGAT1/2-independent enzyme synthesizing storage lipids-like n=1 Tax=Tiliqua scincoides TaxID=71010 RepID=UPI0034621B8D